MSIASDKFEKDITKSINSLEYYSATQGTDVKYSDVKVVNLKNNKHTWVEVKMSHSDNLSNPRVFYKNNKWQTTYSTPAASEAIRILNESQQAKTFIKSISQFSGIPEKHIIIATNKGQLKESGCVPLHVMKSYFSQPGVNRYIASKENYPIGSLVTKHYLTGKAEPATYLQAGDDFYMIGDINPFNLDKNIPKLSGSGDFKVRISTRSEFYEVQAEIKIKHFSPSNSLYSVAPHTKKKNPFTDK